MPKVTLTAKEKRDGVDLRDVLRPSTGPRKTGTRRVPLTGEEIQLLANGLAFWTSDYNDAPHAEIEVLRKKLVKLGAKP